MAKPMQSQLEKILEEVSKNINKEPCGKHVNATPVEGSGFLSDLYKSSITHQDQLTNFVVKKKPSASTQRSTALIDSSFTNELLFYNDIMAEYKKLQGASAPVPTFYKYSENDVVVLEDISMKSFQRRDHFFFDDTHLRKIFETYGRFHALSFSVQKADIKTSPLGKLVSKIIPSWKNELESSNFVKTFVDLANIAHKALDQNAQKDIAQAFKKYTVAGEFKEIFLNLLKDESKFACVLHGDCGSNNILFKYKIAADYSQIDEVKLLDFQQINYGSVVFDLSSVLYLAESKDLFKNLDDYLKIYRDSLENTLSALDASDVTIPSIPDLRQEWVKYAKLGLILSLLFTKLRLMKKEDLIAIVKSAGGSQKDASLSNKFDQKEFSTKIAGILEHLHSLNAL